MDYAANTSSSSPSPAPLPRSRPRPRPPSTPPKPTTTPNNLLLPSSSSFIPAVIVTEPSSSAIVATRRHHHSHVGSSRKLSKRSTLSISSMGGDNMTIEDERRHRPVPPPPSIPLSVDGGGDRPRRSIISIATPIPPSRRRPTMMTKKNREETKMDDSCSMDDSSSSCLFSNGDGDMDPGRTTTNNNPIDTRGGQTQQKPIYQSISQPVIQENVLRRQQRRNSGKNYESDISSLSEGKEAEESSVQNNNETIRSLVVPSVVAQQNEEEDEKCDNRHDGDTRNYPSRHPLQISTKGKALQQLRGNTTGSSGRGDDPRIRMAKHKIRNLGKELFEFEATHHSSNNEAENSIFMELLEEGAGGGGGGGGGGGEEDQEDKEKSRRFHQELHSSAFAPLDDEIRNVGAHINSDTDNCQRMELSNGHNNSSSYYYVECPSTGNFYRGDTARGGGDAAEGVVDNQHSIDDKRQISEEESRERYIRLVVYTSKAFLFFLQGILAGFSIQTLYDATTVDTDYIGFARQYGSRSIDTVRFYFGASTLCLTGSLTRVSTLRQCTNLTDDEDKDDDKGRTMAGSRGKAYIWTILYFLSLVLTLSITRADLYFERLFQLINNESSLDSIIVSMGITRQELVADVKRWRSTSITRSLCCVLAWILACHNIMTKMESRRAQ